MLLALPFVFEWGLGSTCGKLLGGGERRLKRNSFSCSGSQVCKYVPGQRVPELNTFKGWSKDRMMPMSKWMELRKRICLNIEDFGWEECKKAAKDLGLDYEQVSGRR